MNMPKENPVPTSKHCNKCSTIKPLQEFNKNANTKDGHQTQCRECAREYRQSPAGRAAKARHHKSDKCKATQKRYAESDRGKAMIKQYRESDAWVAMVARRGATWNVKNPIKRKAQKNVANALITGVLTKPKGCLHCGAEDGIEGHHADYLKPLEVEWLCVRCHNDWHMKHGTGING